MNIPYEVLTKCCYFVADPSSKMDRVLHTIEGDNKILVVRDAENTDTLYALNPTCTHQGCPVDFEQDQQNIFCACHGSTYKIDGSVIKGPASSPLETYDVKVDGDTILVNPKST